MSDIEKLPHTIISADGVHSFLRIKQQKSKKKWVVRYIRKRTKDDSKRNYTYKETLGVRSRTIEGAASSMRRALIIAGYTENDGATLIHNNRHII